MNKEDLKKPVKLEEMDWIQAKTTTADLIRQNMISLEINNKILDLCNKKLEEIWNELPEDEKKKRTVQIPKEIDIETT